MLWSVSVAGDFVELREWTEVLACAVWLGFPFRLAIMHEVEWGWWDRYVVFGLTLVLAPFAVLFYVGAVTGAALAVTYQEVMG